MNDLKFEIPSDGPCHKIIPNPSSNKLIVFFSGADKSNGRFDFLNSATSLPYNILLINNGINAWYQNQLPGFSSSLSDTLNKISSCAKMLNCNDIIMIGVSMGGYAAVLFGSLLNARVLAFSFDTILKHPLSRSAKRMPRNIKIEHKSLRKKIESSKSRIIAMCGEMDFPDLISLSRISDLPNVESYSVRGVTHGVGRFLDKRYGISNIIISFVENNSLPFIKESSNLCRDKIQSKNIFMAHQAILENNFSLAISLAEKILEKDPLSEPGFFIMGLANLGVKNYSNAIKYFSSTVGMSPYYFTAKYYLAKSLRLYKRNEHALQHFFDYLEVMPSSAGAHHNLSLIYEKRGDLLNAKIMAKKAYELDPKKPSYFKRHNILNS